MARLIECAGGCGAQLMEDEEGPLCCECWQKERDTPPQKGDARETDARREATE